MSYSKITKKGQMTIPVRYRKKYDLKEGAIITFEETDEGLLIKPVPDITDSAGALSNYAEAEELLLDLIKAREKGFR